MINKEALDKGFIRECVNAGISDPAHVVHLMKIANQALAQPEYTMRKSAALAHTPPAQRYGVVHNLVNTGIGGSFFHD